MDLREIDALVAEKVMGKCYYRAEHKTFSGRYIYKDRHLNGWQKEEYVNGRYKEWEFYGPHYSTDIAAAWQVVEKLNKDDFYMDYDINEYRCQFKKGRQMFERAETAPLAICKAALRTVGVEIE